MVYRADSPFLSRFGFQYCSLVCCGAHGRECRASVVAVVRRQKTSFRVVRRVCLHEHHALAYIEYRDRVVDMAPRGAPCEL